MQMRSSVNFRALDFRWIISPERTTSCDNQTGGRPLCPIMRAGYKTRRQITTLIHRYVAALEARGIPVERVILFGSHAAGHAQEWSDIDIAVISPKFDALSLLERYEQLGLA